MIRHAASSSGWIGLRRNCRCPPAVHPLATLSFQRRRCSTLFVMTAQTGPPPGRNQPCRCGSGRKYKHCCSSERRRKSGRRTGPSRSGKATGSIVPGSQLDAETRGNLSNGSALESNLDLWLRAALADSTQSRRQLSDNFIGFACDLRDGRRCCRSRLERRGNRRRLAGRFRPGAQAQSRSPLRGCDPSVGAVLRKTPSGAK